MIDNPFTTDPSPIDGTPAALVALRFQVKGLAVNGTYLRAAGGGAAPAVILLHGFPGYEANFDLGHVLRRAGIHVLIFHYRGAWGSQGRFSFANVLEDTAAAIDYLRDPENQPALRCDPDRIALIGHSMGGFTALLTGAARPDVLGVASLAGFNFGGFGKRLRADPVLRATICEAYKENVLPLGNADPVELVEELMANGDAWDVTAHTARLTAKPVLLVGAAHDVVSDLPSHHHPLAAALLAAGAGRLQEEILPADHIFSETRIGLARVVLRWATNLFAR